MPKTIGFFLDGLQVEFLAEGFWDDALALGRDDERLVDERAQARAAILGVKVEQPDEVGRAHGEALRAAGIEQREEFLGAGDGLAGALELQPVVARGEADPERLFDPGEVGFAAAVKLMQVAGVGIAERLGVGHGFGSCKR